MFLPQVVTAVTGSLLGGRLAQRFGIKRVFLAGLAADLASMVLLIISQFFTSDQAVAYTHRLPGGRLRPDGAGHQRAHGRLSPGPGRWLRARAERVAGLGHRTGAGIRGDLCRPGVLVGPAG